MDNPPLEPTNGVRHLKLRAGERVRNYLLAEFASATLEDGCRLPSNKELARRLNVSSRTVHGVLQRFAEEGRIRAKRGSGTYLVAESKAAPQSLRIIISVPLGNFPGHDQWTDQIGGGIFHAALKSQPPVILEGINQKHWGTDGVVDELMAKHKTSDGLILLPYSLAERHRFVLDAYAEAGKPVVHLHPPYINATADYVSSDLFNACMQLGEIWVKTGRRRIAILNPYSEAGKRNTGFQLRHGGLACGIGGALGKSVDLCIIDTLPDKKPTMDESAGYAAMKQHLAEGNALPDALFCVGDFTAHGAMRALLEAGLEIPRDVSVIGGTGIDIHGSPGIPSLSCIRQPLSQIGEAVLNLLLRRIELKGISLPAVIVRASFFSQNSTREEENTLLSKALAPPFPR